MTQQIFSCEIVNSELENGFSSENDLEHSLQVNGFSPEWVLGGFWDFLIPKMTWNILYKGGEVQQQQQQQEVFIKICDAIFNSSQFTFKS